MLSATATLNNAQIKTSPGTPVVIIPATETLDYTGAPTTIPLPIAAVVTLNIVDAYTNVGGDPKLILTLGSDWSLDLMSARWITSQGTAIVYRLSPADYLTSSVSPADPHFHEVTTDPNGSVLDGGIYDNAIAIAFSNGDGTDLTGGNAANSMKVTVFYVLVDL